MSVTLGDAFVRVRPDTDNFEAETKSGIGSGLKKVAGLIGVTLFGKALKDGANAVVGKASDLNETVNKSSVIFGKNADAILRWSTRSDKAFGLTQASALASAASFGDMFSQIGFTEKASARMSKSTVKMAADLGSFNNLETDDVLDRISASLRGEFDSLQAVIPNINAARVQTKALAMTGKESAESLTAQEKAAATLAIIHKDGARAMGDFKRTQDGYANSNKVVAAQVENLKTKIGSALLPIWQAASNVLRTEVMPPALEFADKVLPKIAAGVSKWVGSGDPGEMVGKLKTELSGIDWPGIGESIADLGDSFTTLGKGLSGVSLDTVNDTVSVFGEVIGFAADHVDLLAKALPFLVGGLIAYRGAQLVNNAVGRDSIIGFGLQLAATRSLTLANRELAASLASVNGASGGMVSGVSTATTRVSRLGQVAKVAGGAAGIAAIAHGTQETNKALGVLETTAGGALTGFAVGGPWGAAIGAGVGLLGGLWKATRKTSNEMPTAADAAKKYATQIDAIANASGRARRAEILRLLQMEDGVIPAAQQLGIDTNVLVAALGGNDRAVRKINGAWKTHQGVLDAMNLEKITTFLTDQGWALSQSDQQLDENRAALKKWDGKLRDSGAEVGRMNPKLRLLGNVKPSSKWSALYSADLETATHTTRTKVTEIGAGIEGASGKWKVDMGPLQRRIVGGLGGLSNVATAKANEVGVDIGTGLKTGLGSMFQNVINEAIRIVNGAIQAGKKEADAHSPSRRTHELGRDLGKGLAGGLVSTGDMVAKAAEQVTEKAIDALQKKLESAQGLLSRLGSQFHNISSTVRDAFAPDLLSSESVSDFFTSGTSALDKLKGLSAARKKLLGMGASRGFITQLFQSGNSNLITELAGGSRGQLQDAQSLFGQTNKWAKFLGDSVAWNSTSGGQVLGDRINGVRDEIRELRKDLRDARGRQHAAEHRGGKGRDGIDNGRPNIVQNIYDKSGDPRKTANESARHFAFAGGG